MLLPLPPLPPPLPSPPPSAARNHSSSCLLSLPFPSHLSTHLPEELNGPPISLSLGPLRADWTCAELLAHKTAGLPARALPFAEGGVANGGHGTMDIPRRGK